ncbi:unnamed protein product [Dracunculus medinensis]|uniref:BTB_2 domain-containing protein n=1 Tax=Dracunculus medinensis TaxID=318479 RepID=A0A0N4UN22_DRAME|nr:unnamed protein product [Dracunculus medinensis]
MDGSQDIINLNVSGKRFTVQRGNLLAVPTSKLAEWFRTDPNDNQLDKDKRGNYYLDRDAKTFRHILSYLRMKRENNSLLLSLPSKPEQLAR